MSMDLILLQRFYLVLFKYFRFNWLLDTGEKQYKYGPWDLLKGDHDR